MSMLKSSIEPTFKLSDKFLEQYKDKQPNWGFGNLSYFTYKRTYAREMDDGKQEEFVDTLERVVNGTYRAQEKHCKHSGLPWNGNKAQHSAQEMFRRMWEFKFLPPGRGLWMMGTEHVNKVGSAALNNCGFVSTENINVELGTPFAWAMDMLMLGVGIGFDTKGAGKVKLRSPETPEIDLDVQSNIFIIPDTREGWVQATKELINSYTNGKYIHFDYSNIRPAGQPIRGFGGISSGPQPLIDAHNSIRAILDSLAGEFITSVAIVDIMNFIGKCVVAGNVRRSAELAIGEITDTEYVTMKDHRLHSEELLDRRWASNNSVFVDQYTDFSSLTDNILLNGEPGLIFLDNARHYGRVKDGWLKEDDRRYDHVMGFNPCAEQQLESYELCCLVETFPSNHDSIEDYHRTLKFAYLYAKTVTLIPTHEEKTNTVIMRNRRIGTSQSGIQQGMNKFTRQTFLNKLCDEGYTTLKRWDRIYSRWLGVPESIRITTVKPSGTVSLLAGVWPGIHFTHSEAYWRTVRLAANSQYIQPLLDANFKIEFNLTDWKKLQEAYLDAREVTISDTEAKWRCTNLEIDASMMDIVTWFALKGGTLIVYFPVIESNFNKSKFDVTLWEQMAAIREMQYYWADNSVSCTITIREEEKKDLRPAIELNAPYVKTLSFLPLTNHKYEQAPYIEDSLEEILAYQKRLGKLDLTKIANQKIAGSKYCDSDKCEI
jgi:ribonucleoside-triphosphate reductase (thioredoxin)